MRDNTMILDLQDGTVRAIHSSDLAGARVAIRTDGQPERILEVRPILADEIEQYVRDYRSCEQAGLWHSLNDARNVVHAALIAASGQTKAVAERLHVPIEMQRPSDPAILLAELQSLYPSFSTVRHVLSEILVALDSLGKVERQALQASGSAPAAPNNAGRKLLRLGDVELSLG